MKNKSLAVKISAIAFLLILVNSVILGLISYSLFRKEAVMLYGDQAQTVAQSVAVLVDGDHVESTLATLEADAQYDEVKALFDDIKTNSDITYLYIVDRNNTFYVQGVAARDRVGLHLLGDTEGRDTFPEEMYTVFSDNRGQVTEELYNSEGFGLMVSAYEPIRNSAGQTVAVLGVDIGAEEVNAVIRGFVINLVLVVAATCLAASFAMSWLIRRIVGRPIGALTKASQKLAIGETDIDVAQLTGDDEIGKLASSFQRMIHATQDQVSVFQAISKGELDADVELRSERDAMGVAIQNSLDNLNNMFSNILVTASQVDLGAHQISDGAQLLASGTAEQAASIEELSSSITEISYVTRENAAKAAQADEFVSQIQQSAEEGNRQMGRMISAVDEISEANKSIEKVIKAIDEIAFQTNILALNAAVEAARAGSHGKGFAVVADEVRTLSQKSAEAARETGQLISNTVEKARLGAKISGETAASLQTIIDGVTQGQQLIREIAQAAESQNDAIQLINQGIEQVNQVVQQNSATSQQSAAASEEMSAQASQLQSLVARFRLRNGVGTGRTPLRAVPAGPVPEPAVVEEQELPASASAFSLEKYETAPIVLT